MNMKSWQLTALVVGGISLAALYVLANSACNVIISCSVGRYEGQVTLTDLETREPIQNGRVRAYIDYDSAPLIQNKKPYIVTTDAEGKASIEFAKTYGVSQEHPLALSFSSEERDSAALFFIDANSIKVDTTISESEPVRFVEGGFGGKDGEKNKSINLTLEVSEWSLF